MWPSGLLLHASNQRDPGLIPGEAEAHTFCIFFIPKNIYRSSLEDFREEMQ